MNPITKYRLAKGLSVRQLAQEIGVTTQAIYAWEKLRAFPRRENVEKLEEVLDVTGLYYVMLDYYNEHKN